MNVGGRCVLCNWCVYHNGDDADDDWQSWMKQPGKYDEEDAAVETETTEGDVRRTWHQAREDAQKSGELPEREEHKEEERGK